jgi:hypothetical protein
MWRLRKELADVTEGRDSLKKPWTFSQRDSNEIPLHRKEPFEGWDSEDVPGVACFIEWVLSLVERR